MLHCPRNITRAVAYSSLFLAAGVASALAADPTGDWRVEDGVANIRIAECNGSMWGVVSWEKTPGGRDKNNPDASKQNRPTLAMPTLLDMKKKPGVDQWEGKVYNANDGQIYSATIKPLGSDQLQVQGCLLGFLCGGQTWTRVAGPIPSSPVNSMARGAPKTAGAARTAAPSTSATGRCPEDHRLDQPGSQSGAEAGRGSARRHRRYLPTPRSRAACPLAPAGTTAPRPVW